MFSKSEIFISNDLIQVEAVHLVKYGVDIRMLPLLLALIPLGGSRAGCKALLPSHASHPIVLLRVEHHPPLLLLHPSTPRPVLLTSPGPS